MLQKRKLRKILNIKDPTQKEVELRKYALELGCGLDGTYTSNGVHLEKVVVDRIESKLYLKSKKVPIAFTLVLGSITLFSFKIYPIMTNANTENQNSLNENEMTASGDINVSQTINNIYGPLEKTDFKTAIYQQGSFIGSTDREYDLDEDIFTIFEIIVNRRINFSLPIYIKDKKLKVIGAKEYIQKEFDKNKGERGPLYKNVRVQIVEP